MTLEVNQRIYQVCWFTWEWFNYTFLIILGKYFKRQRTSKLSALEVLEKKFEKKAELKEKELDLWKKELELQERKLISEEEERKKRVELELEERRTMMELLKKHLV